MVIWASACSIRLTMCGRRIAPLWTAAAQMETWSPCGAGSPSTTVLCQPARCRVLEPADARIPGFPRLDPGTTAVEVIIREGRKNQVKRMLSKIGHPVIALHRCRFGELRLGDLAEGSWRELTDEEVASLKSAPRLDL